MTIKISVTDNGGCEIEVPGKTTLPWAVAAIKAIKNDEIMPAAPNGHLVDVTPPSNRLGNKPLQKEDIEIPKPVKTPEPEPAAVAEPKKQGPKAKVKSFPTEEESKASASILIKSGQSFLLSKVCPYQTETKRKKFMKWLTETFQVEIMPKVAGKPVNMYNPYVVVPYTEERAGHKVYAPMPWEFEKEAVKGAGAKPVRKQEQEEPEAVATA